MVYCSCVKNNVTTRIKDQPSCPDCDLQCRKQQSGYACIDDIHDNSKYINLVWNLTIILFAIIFMLWYVFYIINRSNKKTRHPRS